MPIVCAKTKPAEAGQKIHEGLRILARIIAREIVNTQLQVEAGKILKEKGGSEYLRDK